MTDVEGRDEEAPDPPESGEALEEELGLLRSLLLGEEQEKITQVHQRLEDPQLHAEDISRVLPEAFLIRMGRDEKLTRALTPIIEDSFQVSVRRNPKILVDVIAPIMGPAIRRAIFQAISGMIQSFNHILEHSLSRRGLKWRLEAFRTGKPFAEVVLLHTLVYQVEQVFLIHRETGLLLQHVVTSSVKAMDADMVSGMLTAIQDFVQDSFGGDREDSLQAMQVGERTVWVEQGPHAVLAGVIQGNAPSQLRTVFEEALESIHLEQREALQAFAGDASVFEPCRVYLEECLQSQFRAEEEPEKKSAWPVWLGLATVVLALGIWGYWGVLESRRWDAYLQRLEEEPGIVVTQAERRDGGFFVAGMRDPLAADPRIFVELAELNPEQVAARWEAYLSFSPEFTLRRSRKQLAPPPEVKIEVVEGVLHISGRAPHEWISRVEERARAIPGIIDVDLHGLEDADRLLLEALERKVEGQVVYFGLVSARLDEKALEELAALAEVIVQLEETGARLGKRMRLLLSGYADESGSEKANREISQMRADAVARLLIADGVSAGSLQATGMGSLSFAGEGEEAVDRSRARKVVFSVVLAGEEN